MYDYIRLSRVLLLIGALAVAISVYIKYKVYQLPITLVSVAEVLGGVIGLIVVPALAAALWRGLQRRRGRYSDGPAGLAFILFALMAYFVIAGASADMEPSTYAEEGCEFLVDFPRIPEVTSMTAGQRSWKQVNAHLKNTLLRAECNPIYASVSEEGASLIVDAFASEQGLAVRSRSVTKTQLGLMGHIVGEKQLSGKLAMYELQITFGESSVIALVVGSAASDFPPDEADPFFSSLRRNPKAR